MTGTVLSRVPIADIEIADGGRSLQNEKVADIVASKQRIGRLNPTGVRMVDGDSRLVYARHRALVNVPTGMTIAHKQLALIAVLEELTKAYPADHQMQNSLAVVTTILLGSRLLTAMSATVRLDTVQ